MSHPAANHRPDDTAPPARAAKGLVCPKCQRRFEEGAAAPPYCPDDRSPLVRVADMSVADSDPMLGRVLAGRFAILAKLGAGSMGTVYRAKQAPIGRDVAIKILRSDRAIDEVSRARFLREARANSLLTSPNTVTVFDFGQSETGDFYLAMELLEGESLGQRIKRLGRLGIDAAIDTTKQALRSLAEAHAKGIVHRDLKPDNLFYARVLLNERPGEVVKVLDFGIAKMLHADAELAMNVVETQAGTVFGTPRYMSPEQAQGKTLDARSDLYSLGVILYHMLTGRPPYTDDDAIVVMARHIKTPPRPISEVAPEARIPPEIEAAVMRVLSKEPDKRPATADAMIEELTRAREAAASSITSGVRASIASGIDALEKALPGIAHASVPPAAGRAAAGDSLSVAPQGVPSRLQRWMLAGGAAALLAFVAAGIVLVTTVGKTRVAPAAPSASAAAAPVRASAVPTPPTTATTSTPPATANTIPTVAASTLKPQPAGGAPRPGRLPGASKPAGTSSVGYGYLE